MSTFTDRPRQALLVIDVQKGVVDWAYERDRVVRTIAQLVSDARRFDVPVVWVQHNEPEMPVGSEPWQIAPELEPLPDEPRVDKQFRSSFEQTDLDAVLESLGVGSLVVCGAETNFCIRHTMHSAIDRGYDVTLVADAHTAVDSEEAPAAAVIAEQNRNAAGYTLPGRRCDVTTAEQAFPR